MISEGWNKMIQNIWRWFKKIAVEHPFRIGFTLTIVTCILFGLLYVWILQLLRFEIQAP